MKKLRKAVSLVAVVAIMATMFAAPLGANAADETDVTLYTSPNLTPNPQTGAPEIFQKETTGAELNGTYKVANYSYATSNALYGGVGDMTIGFLGAATADKKVYLNASALTSNAQKYSLTDNDRIVWEANVNIESGVANVLLMKSAGLNITTEATNLPANGKWFNIKVYYQPKATYYYTEDGTAKTLSTNVIRDYNNASDTAAVWKTILGDSYDSSKTYALTRVVYGACDYYIDGVKVMSNSGIANDQIGYVGTTSPTRLTFNISSDAKIYYSNAKVSIIKNCTVGAQTMSPFANENKDGNYVSDANNIYIKEGTKLSDITLNEGYEMAAYTDMTAGGTYPNVAADSALADGNTVMVRDKNTYQMRGYTVKTSTYDTLYNYDGTIDLNGGGNLAYEITTDGTYKINESTSTWRALVNETASAKETQLKTFDGYVKISFKIMPTKADSNTNFYVGTYQSADISGTVSFDMLNENEWNQIDLILNTTGKSTGSSSTLYINNTLTTAATSTVYLDSNADSHRLRFVLRNVTADAPVYMDDITVTKEYLHPNGFAYADDFKYSDNDFVLMTSFSPASMGLIRFDVNWKLAGIGGKSSSDRSLQVVKKINTDANAKEKNAYLQFNYKKGPEKYLIIKYNVLMPSGQDLNYNFIAENGHENLSQTMYLSEDVWHEVTDIIEFVDDTTAKYTTYVDGTYYGRGNTSEDFAKGDATRNLRFDICGIANKTFVAYFDDFVIYRSNTAPTVTPQQLPNSFDGDIKVADGNTMYIPSNATVAHQEGAYYIVHGCTGKGNNKCRLPERSCKGNKRLQGIRKHSACRHRYTHSRRHHSV